MNPGHPQPVTFNVSELPDRCRKIEAAYIWWIVSDTNEVLKTHSFQIKDPKGNIFKDTALTVGTGRKKGWAGEKRTVCFRGNVTDFISENGDYQVKVSSSRL